MGADRWSASRKLPEEVFWRTDAVVSGIAGTDVPEGVETGSEDTCTLVGSVAGVAVARIEICGFTGADGPEETGPAEACDTVRAV